MAEVGQYQLHIFGDTGVVDLDSKPSSSVLMVRENISLGEKRVVYCGWVGCEQG